MEALELLGRQDLVERQGALERRERAHLERGPRLPPGLAFRDEDGRATTLAEVAGGDIPGFFAGLTAEECRALAIERDLPLEPFRA